MNLYTTLKDEEFNIDELPPNHQKAYTAVRKHFDASMDWTDFANFWLNKMRELTENGNKSGLVRSPLYRICQDMESRLGIKQGYVRKGDYRDYLAMIIDLEFPSRYAFCKEVGLDQSFLSHVLNRDKDFSMEKLETILSRIGYEVALRKKTDHAGSPKR
jgi:hypothetical protein